MEQIALNRADRRAMKYSKSVKAAALREEAKDKVVVTAAPKAQ